MLQCPAPKQPHVFYASQMCLLRREFYEHLRDWIVETELDRYRSGRVFEYMWAIMFGAPPVSQPLEECDLLTCTDEVWAQNPSHSAHRCCTVLSPVPWSRGVVATQGLL